MSSQFNGLWFSLVILLLFGCDSFRYDEPPLADLVELSKPRTLSDPVEIIFTEPVFGPSLALSLWPRILDIEGELRSDVEPLVAEESCRFGVEGGEILCGPIVAVLSEDRRSAVLTLDSTFFGDYAGAPLMLRVASGLASADPSDVMAQSSGNISHQVQDFQLMFFDQCQMGQPVGDLNLNSNVILVTADVGDLVEAFPGIYLRIYVDFVIDPETGAFTAVGTAGDLWSDVKQERPTSSSVEDHFAMLSNRGWMVFVTGELCEAEEGRYYVKTTPMDASATIAGYVPTTLTDFQLVGYIQPHTSDVEDGGPNSRDTFEGTLLTSGGDVLDGGILLEALSAQFQGQGIYQSERYDTGQVCVEAEANASCQDVSSECRTECGFGQACVAGGCVEVSSKCEPSCRRTFIDQMPATCDLDPCANMTPKGGECLKPEGWGPPSECCLSSSTQAPASWCAADGS